MISSGCRTLGKCLWSFCMMLFRCSMSARYFLYLFISFILKLTTPDCYWSASKLFKVDTSTTRALEIKVSTSIKIRCPGELLRLASLHEITADSAGKGSQLHWPKPSSYYLFCSCSLTVSLLQQASEFINRKRSPPLCPKALSVTKLDSLMSMEIGLENLSVARFFSGTPSYFPIRRKRSLWEQQIMWILILH